MYRSIYTWNFVRMVLDSIPAMIWFKDTKNVLLFANKKVCEVTGLSLEEIEGKSCDEVYPELSAKYYQDDIEVMKSGKPKCRIIEQLPLKTGEKIWIMTDKVPYTDDDGKVLGVVVVTVDINEEKISLEQIEETSRKLEATNDQLKQFAYIASHDLKEPVRVIYSFSQLLMKEFNGRLQPKEKQYFDYIVDAADRMKRMVGDLLEVAQLGQPIEEEDVDLNDVMEDVVKLSGLLVEETGAEINYAELPVISANYNQMVRLFQNLVSNAVKFRKEDEKPIINITCRLEDGYAIVEVEDNGVGIDPKNHESIFYIFKRLNNAKKAPGTGIGLSICKKIVENHDGKIWLESEMGKGTTFFIQLPLYSRK